MFSFLLAALGVAPAAFFYLHGWRDSNSQPMVLETTTLPIELHPFFSPNLGLLNLVHSGNHSTHRAAPMHPAQKDCKCRTNAAKTKAFLRKISGTLPTDYQCISPGFRLPGQTQRCGLPRGSRNEALSPWQSC